MRRGTLDVVVLRVVPVLFAADLLFELVNASGQRLQVQDVLARHLPRHKGHALGIIADQQRILRICLCPLHAGVSVLAHRFGIDDHDLRAAMLMQGQGHPQAITPGRFETDRDHAPALGEPLQQALVRPRRVVKGGLHDPLSGSGQGNGQRVGTDINAGKSGLSVRHRGLL